MASWQDIESKQTQVLQRILLEFAKDIESNQRTPEELEDVATKQAEAICKIMNMSTQTAVVAVHKAIKDAIFVSISAVLDKGAADIMSSFGGLASTVKEG